MKTAIELHKKYQVWLSELSFYDDEIRFLLKLPSLNEVQKSKLTKELDEVHKLKVQIEFHEKKISRKVDDGYVEIDEAVFKDMEHHQNHYEKLIQSIKEQKIEVYKNH